MPRLRILFVASECVPLVKTGGLGDVVGALAPVLRARGHDVRVVLPRYRAVKHVPVVRLPNPLGVTIGPNTHWAAVCRAELRHGVPAYLLEHDEFFDRDGLYGDAQGDFGDNALRFAFLSQGALSLCSYVGFQPDVIHVHDWQSALVPLFPHEAATVLTVHNLGYQGRFALGAADALGVSPQRAADLEYFGQVNLLKGGLLNATMLSTVSPRYAAEIQTSAGGAGLDGILRQRSDDLVGIINGIDTDQWDPRSDRHIAVSYGERNFEQGKARCKAALQAELGLPQRPGVPLIGVVSRFAYQKGIDVFAEALAKLIGLDIQFAVLGSGESWAERFFSQLSGDAPNLRARIGFNEGLAHRIEAGADMFLMPSRYEPCGLNQLYSQRYGTLPIVRAVGGLADTVEHGVTGFVFDNLEAEELAAAVAWAADCYSERRSEFVAMQRAAMRKPMGWDRSATQYDALYRLAVRRRASSRECGPE